MIFNQPAEIETTMDIKAAQPGWKEQYEVQAREALPNYDYDISDTEYYTLDDPLVVSIANDILSKSNSPKEAIQQALTYVYDNIDYVYNEPDSACFTGTASSILASGKGQCDTQAISLIALLRKMKIAAKPVGGCLIVKPSCGLQSFFINSAISLPGMPKYQLTSIPAPGETIFSRADITSRKGGLHAWVTAWIPNEGWLTLEETNGQIVDTACYTYHVELYPNDDNKKELCVSTSWDYASACAMGDINLLNKYGLGDVTNVAPGVN